jgi:hypothetical protein
MIIICRWEKDWAGTETMKERGKAEKTRKGRRVRKDIGSVVKAGGRERQIWRRTSSYRRADHSTLAPTRLESSSCNCSTKKPSGELPLAKPVSSVSGRPIGLGHLGERLAIIDGHCDLVCSPGRKTLVDGDGDRAFTGTIHHKKSEIQKKGMGRNNAKSSNAGTIRFNRALIALESTLS